jgi:hypothetical protein
MYLKNLKYLTGFLAAGALSMLFLSCDSDEPTDPNALKACFQEVPAVTAGTPIQFNSDCSENETSYLWDFGGKGTSTQANPTYAFAAAGTYTIKLTVYRNTESHTSERFVTHPNCTEHLHGIA